LLKLNGADKGQDQADQKADKSDNRQGGGAAILDREHQIRAPKAGPTDKHSADPDQRLSKKGYKVAGGLEKAEATLADPSEEVRAPLGPPGSLALGHATGEAD